MLGSPVSLADQITGWDSQQCCPPAEDSNWINQASREELYDLFTKAGDLIKERESGGSAHNLRGMELTARCD
jgi:hypothetical protein